MDSTRRRVLRLGALGAAASLAGCTALLDAAEDDPPLADDETTGDRPNRKIDDWQYEPTGGGNGGGSGGAANQAAQTGAATEDLGFAAGGAKNIAAFRRNIEEGYLPLPESLAYEGLFYNYYFDTGGSGTCSSLFCPTYSTAVTADPLGGETERYFTVGLNSSLTTEEFDRKRLNLVIVLDVSGSMGASFDQYYYDRFGNRHTVENADETRSKMDVAKDALVALTEQLRPDDRLGIVLYNNGANVAKPVREVGATDMEAIRGHIREDVQAGGGTNLDAGMGTARDMLDSYTGADQTEVETRQIVITDAMPNVGTTDDSRLQQRLSEYADDTVHTSFVGVGVDFNPALVDEITAIEGANYRSVHSAEEFERYLGEEFAYMVTPLVYDLTVELDAQGYDVATVYGSSAAEESTDTLVEVNTLFPSPESEGRTRGGVVLVQVDRQSSGGDLTLRASWEDRTGAQDSTTATIQFPTDSPEHFDNTGVRKAVLLARYGDLLKNWMAYERDPPLVNPDGGIDVPPEESALGEWEQQSHPLAVSEPYAGRIEQFRSHFESEMGAIGDSELSQEVETMETILDAR